MSTNGTSGSSTWRKIGTQNTIIRSLSEERSQLLQNARSIFATPVANSGDNSNINKGTLTGDKDSERTNTTKEIADRVR